MLEIHYSYQISDFPFKLISVHNQYDKNTKYITKYKSITKYR